MTRWIACLLAGPLSRTLAMLTAAATLAVIGASPTLSQQQPAAPKAGAPAQQKPAAKPAAPAAQKGQQPVPAPAQSVPQPASAPQPNLIYTPWTKLCHKGQEANAKTVCQIGKEGRLENGVHVIAAVVIEQEGEAKKVLQLTMPQGVLLPRGTRVIVDKDDQQAIIGPFLVCANAACVAQLEANSDLVARLKKGQQLYVQAFDMQQRIMTLSLPLGDFAKAYDGKPTDPKEIEARNKKLQEELQRRAAEARQKLESQQGQQPAKPK